MKRLDYKGIKFDSFAFTSGEGTYFDESVTETDVPIESAWAYACPYCVEQHGFYDEVDLTPNEVRQYIEDIENSEGDLDDYICCIEGCQNLNATEIYFNAEDCKLIN